MIESKAKNKITLDEWISQLWIDIPRALCTSENKGSKSEFIKELKKLSPDDDLRKEITIGTLKKKRIDLIKHNAGKDFCAWPHAVRHIRQQRWKDYDNEEDPASKSGPSQNTSPACKDPGCTFRAVCLGRCASCHTRSVRHLDPLRQKKKEHWDKMELGRKETESQPEYINRLKKIAFGRGYEIQDSVDKESEG